MVNDEIEFKKAVLRFVEIKKHIAKEAPIGPHVKNIKTLDQVALVHNMRAA